MNDWIGLGVFLFVIAIALVASAQLGKPRRKISVEEFEERARSGGGAAAGMFGLQKLLNPKAVKAIEVQQDLRSGYYNKKKVPGDGEGEAEGAGGLDDGGEFEAETAGEGSDAKGSGERDA